MISIKMEVLQIANGGFSDAQIANGGFSDAPNRSEHLHCQVEHKQRASTQS